MSIEIGFRLEFTCAFIGIELGQAVRSGLIRESCMKVA
jgi:hypothetical protein